MALGKGLESLIPRKSQNDLQENNQKAPTGDELAKSLPEPSSLMQASSVASQDLSQNQHQKLSESLNESNELVVNQKDLKKDYISDNFYSSSSYRHAPKKITEAIFNIEIDKIQSNPHQPRRYFDEASLKELAQSMREFGILQPIVVSKIETETDFGTSVSYQLIAGERRLLAAKMLGWERIPAVIRRLKDKAEGFEMAIVENLQRANLNPIETARAYAKLQDEFNMTQREIASRLGKSRETIANTLRLLNLPQYIQEAIADGKINESQARLLLSVEDLKEQQNIFQELLTKNFSVRALKQRISLKKTQEGSAMDLRQGSSVSPEILHLESELTELLGAQVKIEQYQGNDQGGKIIIRFYSPEEIYGLIQKIKNDGNIT
jgi:ParB family chromosome partitioning protein